MLDNWTLDSGGIHRVHQHKELTYTLRLYNNGPMWELHLERHGAPNQPAVHSVTIYVPQDIPNRLEVACDWSDRIFDTIVEFV